MNRNFFVITYLLTRKRLQYLSSSCQWCKREVPCKGLFLSYTSYIAFVEVELHIWRALLRIDIGCPSLQAHVATDSSAPWTFPSFEIFVMLQVGIGYCFYHYITYMYYIQAWTQVIAWLCDSRLFLTLIYIVVMSDHCRASTSSLFASLFLSSSNSMTFGNRTIFRCRFQPWQLYQLIHCIGKNCQNNHCLIPGRNTYGTLLE